MRLIGGVLFLVLLISAVAWLRSPKMPAFAWLSATRFDGLPLGREELIALPVSMRGILLRPDQPETSVSDHAQAARYAEFEPRLPQSNGQGQALPAQWIDGRLMPYGRPVTLQLTLHPEHALKVARHD